MELIKALNWRYAVKRMNGLEVPREKIDAILEATRLSASSMGLQPYTILEIENKDIRKQLQAAAFNQSQVTEASHLLVFAAWEDVTEDHVHDYLKQISEVRNISLDTLDGFKASLMAIVHGRSKEQKHEWSARQAYIAFGTAITAASMEAVDATPMEGFQPERVDEILKLREKGLRSVTMLALGYRDEEKDFLSRAAKVRRETQHLILKVA